MQVGEADWPGHQARLRLFSFYRSPLMGQMAFAEVLHRREGIAENQKMDPKCMNAVRISMHA